MKATTTPAKAPPSVTAPMMRATTAKLIATTTAGKSLE
jgi:hypothetical protein